jgi:hypothetical protein
VWVQGEYPYTAEYVRRLHGMVTRWADPPVRFVCLTDRPWLLASPIEAVPVTKLAGFAPWTKLELFNPARAWSGRVLSLDLDVLLVAPLRTLLDAAAPFVITADPPAQARARARDAFGRAIVRRVNSSVMAWDGGTQTDLYTDWTPAVASRLSGDQDWIGERRPEAATWPRAWFPRLSELGGAAPADPAKVVLVKVPKNHLAVAQHPWMAPLWGAA